MAPEVTSGRFQGAFLQVLDSIAIRDGELVGSSSEGKSRIRMTFLPLRLDFLVFVLARNPKP